MQRLTFEVQRLRENEAHERETLELRLKLELLQSNRQLLREKTTQNNQKSALQVLAGRFCRQSPQQNCEFTTRHYLCKSNLQHVRFQIEILNGQANIMAKILLVDDDGSVLLTLAIALRRRGHDVTVASDAQQALAQLRRHSFDFLISDVRMPGLSGLELASRVQDMAHPPRVILTSAYPFIEGRENVSEAFLPKPLDVQQLNEHLNSSLQHSARDTVPTAHLASEASRN